MIYSSFIFKNEKYLNSVRIIKGYVTFDMLFSDTWMTPKLNNNDIEVIKGKRENDKINVSFVCKINEKLIDIIETHIEKIIKINIEREEKESLFKNKVNELRSLFDKQKLEDLKKLKFEVDDITKMIEDETISNDEPNFTEGTGEVEERELEKSV